MVKVLRYLELPQSSGVSRKTESNDSIYGMNEGSQKMLQWPSSALYRGFSFYKVQTYLSFMCSWSKTF